jgi:hypothetical protein
MLPRRIGAAALVCAAFEFAHPGPSYAQNAPGTAARTPWRDVLRAWCAEGATPECARVPSLDPDPDPAHRAELAITAADRAAREISALALAAGNQPVWAQTLRETPSMHDASGATALLTQLLNAYVALLPAGARSLARGWSPDTFWHDAEGAQSTTTWRRRVRDAGSPAAALRDQIARAAMLVEQATTQDLAGDGALDAAAELGAMAISRGALRDEVIRVMVAAVEAMPTRPPPPDPDNDGPPEHPSRRQVLIAMESARAPVARCVGPQDATVLVRVSFNGSDGHVADATVTGGFAGTMLAACTRSSVMNVTVPPFDRASVTVNYPYVIFGGHPERQPPPPAIPPAPAVTAVRAPPRPPDAPPPDTHPANDEPRRPRAPVNLPAAPPPDEIERVFTALEGPVRACAPTARHVINIEVTISGGGLADHVAASGRGLPAEARDCIEQAVMNAQFPRFDGAQATVSHRVEFGRHRH